MKYKQIMESIGKLQIAICQGNIEEKRFDTLIGQINSFVQDLNQNSSDNSKSNNDGYKDNERNIHGKNHSDTTKNDRQDGRKDNEKNFHRENHENTTK